MTGRRFGQDGAEGVDRQRLMTNSGARGEKAETAGF